ncbi:glycosyltransferase family A protein [Paenibacillus typhae]|uniref:Glycosyl transferase family 2 n=1 Tax=Paenibacillus typhae TaxID=1174501 RepID=A0A1G8RPR5_9BACL|nr:glycosyltransferase family A protein [Paenibacillus typhae]SDJ18893.1 hypothetical protein SAMN05216192_11310 [Paenibacillus typhae]
MNLEVLISTMNQKGLGLLEEMNIQSDAIVINQSDSFCSNTLIFNDYKVNFLSFDERGIGLSRNNALMRASAEISLLADDDVIYIDGYREAVIKSFEENPHADMIFFNVPSKNHLRPTHIIKKKSRVRWYNCLKYGAVKVAFRTEKLKQANIYFSLLFGGGAKYGSGEDSLFISECIQKGLKIYTDPTIIGYVKQEESTWFKGYNDKFFKDKGVLFYFISKKWARLLCLQFVIRHRKMFANEKNVLEAYKLMLKGVEEI